MIAFVAHFFAMGDPRKLYDWPLIDLASWHTTAIETHNTKETGNKKGEVKK